MVRDFTQIGNCAVHNVKYFDWQGLLQSTKNSWLRKILHWDGVDCRKARLELIQFVLGIERVA